MNVEIWTNTLRKNTNDIDSNLEDCENNIDNVYNIVFNNIPAIWQGNDYTYFKENMQDFIIELRKLKHSIETYNSFIKGYLESVETLDKHYQSKEINLE